MGLELVPVLGDAVSRFCLLPAAAAQLSSWSFRHPGGRPHARLAPRLLVPLDFDPRLPWSFFSTESAPLPRALLVAAVPPPMTSRLDARAAGQRRPLTWPLPYLLENYYYRLELLDPKRFSEGRLSSPPPLMLDDYGEPPAI